jgi:uncharacterized membrane protein (UPF0127 family)
MAWLVRDGEVLATLEVARSVRARSRGLLGRDGIDGALLLQRAKSVHTFGMRFPIDVAFVDRDLVVIRTVAMRPWRVGRVVLKAHGVIEAEAGSFARWDLKPGDPLEVKG